MAYKGAQKPALWVSSHHPAAIRERCDGPRQEIAAGHLVLLDIKGLPLIRHWYVTRLKIKRLSPAAEEFERFLLQEGGALVDAWS